MKALKWIASLALMLCLVLPIADASSAKETGEPVEGNLIRIHTLEDFEKGTLTNAEASASQTSDGAVRLAAGQTDGEFVSPIFAVQPFEEMVASWNAQAPVGTYVEVKARAYIDTLNTWTEWLSWGKWSADITLRSSTDQQSDLAGMSTDEFIISGSDGKTASLLQLKVELHSDDPAATPVLEQVAVTYRNTLEGQAIPVTHSESQYEGTLPEKVEPTAPAISQSDSVREPSIGSVMCSAVTICTILNAHGEDLLPEQVALLCYDTKYDGFGNWAFSVATAGAFGYDAYVQYADLDLLRNELANGNPVGISVRYSASENGSYPYVEGAPLDTAGHLITITGYETVDGVDYFYSSDSAAGSDVSCLRRYRADQLDVAWGGHIAYIVHEKQDPSVPAVENVEAELMPVEGKENAYALKADGIQMDTSFRSNKLSAKGGGIVCYTVEGQNELPGADQLPVVVKANQVFNYSVTFNADGSINFDPRWTMPGAQPGDTWTFHLYVMTNDGKFAEPSLDVTKPVESGENGESGETGENGEDAANPAPPAASGGIDDGTAGLIAVAVIAVSGVAAYVAARKNKKKQG